MLAYELDLINKLIKREAVVTYTRVNIVELIALGSRGNVDAILRIAYNIVVQ